MRKSNAVLRKHNYELETKNALLNSDNRYLLSLLRAQASQQRAGWALMQEALERFVKEPMNGCSEVGE